MLLLSTVVLLALLGTLLLALFFWSARFNALFSARPERLLADEELPRTVVLLSLRGADPSLTACLQGLLDQDYPNYDVRIVIDSLEDPARDVVHRILDDFPAASVQVIALESPRQTCSLKLSALVQVLGSLDECYEAVVLIDADVIPHRGWLRDLVAPLSDPTVGATTGIRWYAPEQANWGSLVRHVWNAAASALMHALHIPWGGSLAFRADILRRSDVLDRWAVGLVEDAGFYGVIQALGLRLRCVPAATMVNRESTDLPSCFRFIRRQMLNIRLYHPSWPFVLGHGLALSLAPALALGLLGAACASGRWNDAALLAGGLAGYAVGMGCLLMYLERPVRRLSRQRGALVSPLSWRTWAAIPLTQAVYVVCLLSAACLRVVDWRGITYHLRGPWDVRLVEYRPYQSRETAVDRTASIV